MTNTSKSFTKYLKLSLLLGSSLIISACSFAPDYVQPKLEIPSNWTESAAMTTKQNVTATWWERFEDPTLNLLIQKTLAHNYDLLIAAENVSQAQSYIGVTRSALFPSISLGGTAQNAQRGAVSSSAQTSAQAFTAGFQAAWELDFWGKFRNANNAARQQLFASEYTQESLKLILTAQTAIAYFNLLSLDEQLEVSYRTLATREESLRIYTAQYNEGLINELDYLRASTEVDVVRATIAQLLYQVDNAETALQVLAGASPKEIFESEIERAKSLTQIPPIPQLPNGVPSELLLRRPDILAAEAGLRSANFQVGVAKSYWFPSISLTGMLGFESSELSRLFTPASDAWTYGGSLLTPIFQAGKIYNNVKISESQMRAAALTYQKTVQTAFKEMHTALSVQKHISSVVKSFEHIVESLTNAVELAQIRYDNGYASYLEVLDAQRSLFDAEIQLANARASQLSTIVNICMALGGGWTDEINPTVITEKE